MDFRAEQFTATLSNRTTPGLIFSISTDEALSSPTGHTDTKSASQERFPRAEEGEQEGVVAGQQVRASAEEEWTTVMIKNIPNNMTRDRVHTLLTLKGCDHYDFLYVPCDLHRLSGLGYAFVNFLTNGHAKQTKVQLDGFKDWSHVDASLTSTKVCEVWWGRPEQQGLQWQIEHYRNSPLMHDKVPDHCRPALFKHGERLDFPAPTKKLRAPRFKNCRPSQK